MYISINRRGEMIRDLPKGDLPLLVLAVLNEGSRHGYAIAREIERISDNALSMREGSLYPALRVLETDGMIVGKWEIQPVGPGAQGLFALRQGARGTGAPHRRLAPLCVVHRRRSGRQGGKTGEQTA
jgi:PadR family transcriptional regulator PadR